MKFSFPKKDIEVHEPELSVEEQLKEALEEINYLTDKLPVPLKESKKELKKRYAALSDNLKKRYEDSIKEAKDAYEEGLAFKNEYENLKEKEKDILSSLAAQDNEREQRLTELQDEFNAKQASLEAEYIEKIQELEAKATKDMDEFNKRIRDEEARWEEERKKIEAEKITADAFQETRQRNFNIEMVNIRHDAEKYAAEMRKAAEEAIELQRSNWEKDRSEALKNLEQQKKMALREIKTLREAAEKELSDRRSLLEEEFSEAKANFEAEINQKREELVKEVEREHNNIQAERDKLDIECKTVLDKIEDDKKALTDLEKQIEKKTVIDKTLNKKLAKKIVPIILAFIIIAGFICFNFRYSVFPVSNIKNSINNAISNDYQELRGNIVLTVNGEAITKINLVNGVNRMRSEEIFGLQIRDDKNTFEWERYNKGDAEFIKTPMEPQYVLATNRTDAGWYYDINDSRALEKLALYGIVSGIDITDTNVVSEYTDGNILENFGIFLRNRFSPDHVMYDFTLSKDTLNSLYGVLASSPGYKAFIEEEGYITEQLKLSNSFEDIDDLFVQISTSNISEGTGKIQIESGRITSMSLNFKGTNTSSESIGIYCSISFIPKDKDNSYDNNRYLMNSMKYDEVYPRIEQNKFSDIESQGQIQENVSTIKALEEEGYQIMD